jgi:hypothetical protein
VSRRSSVALGSEPSAGSKPRGRLRQSRAGDKFGELEKDHHIKQGMHEGRKGEPQTELRKRITYFGGPSVARLTLLAVMSSDGAWCVGASLDTPYNRAIPFALALS